MPTDTHAPAPMPLDSLSQEAQALHGMLVRSRELAAEKMGIGYAIIHYDDTIPDGHLDAALELREAGYLVTWTKGRFLNSIMLAGRLVRGQAPS